jgi:nitrogen-specific signal transduction histidine kinase
MDRECGHTLLRILQIIMFNIIGYLTGLKAQKEKNEKQRYQQTVKELERLLKKLKQQSDELSDLEEQLRLSDRLAVVGELTTSLAHELRNPLGTIRSTVEILNDELPQKTKKTEFFQILIREIERMNTVVENYLSFAHKQKIPDASYDVREIVRNTCLILSSRA